jgi:hypothetical protein
MPEKNLAGEELVVTHPCSRLDCRGVPGSAAVVADDVEPVVNERRVRIITGIVTVVPILSLFFVGWQLWASQRRTG